LAFFGLTLAATEAFRFFGLTSLPVLVLFFVSQMQLIFVDLPIFNHILNELTGFGAEFASTGFNAVIGQSI
jgi:hypothetical protein